jgi:cysteine-rich repeat protein
MFTVVKLEGADGQTLWRIDIDGTGKDNEEDVSDEDEARAVALDAGGGVVVGGHLFTDEFRVRGVVVHLDANGADYPCGGAVCGNSVVSSVCGEQCDDGNTASGDGCSATCQEAAPAESLTSSADPGVPVTTDGESDGATPADPVETSVTSPNAGTVSITERPASALPAGFRILGQEIDIDAPSATAGMPLILRFLLDASRVPSGPGSQLEIEILKNGEPVAPCAGAAGTADPDPCVASSMLVGDDTELTILTSTASEWALVESVALVDRPVSGGQLVIKNAVPDVAAKSKAVVKSKDSSIVAAAAGGPDDPRLVGGSIRFTSDTTASDTGSLPLPAVGIQGFPNWSPIGNAANPSGWKYKDKEQDDGPCKVLVLKFGKNLKAVCSGKNPSQPFPFDLQVGQSEGNIAAALTIGTLRHCMEFPPFSDKDGSNGKLFASKNVPAPSACVSP